MGFLAILVFLVLGRAMRGCAKWVLVLLLVALIWEKEPALCNKLWVLLGEAEQELREFVEGL